MATSSLSTSTNALTKFPNIWKLHGTEVNARYYNGGVFTGETIQAAIDDAEGDETTIFLESGTWVQSTAVTSESNIYLKFAPGALIQPAAGISFTINSPEHIYSYSVGAT